MNCPPNYGSVPVSVLVQVSLQPTAQPVVYCCDIPWSPLQAALATTVTMVTLLCCFNEYAALLHRGLLALSPIVW